MVRKGDIIYNPLKRETVTFILTGAETAGASLQMDITVAPGEDLCDATMHVHPKQTETLTIKSGRVWATVNRQKKLYGPGDTIVIPAGTPHKWENASNKEELNFICEMTPALYTAALYETAAALSQTGKQEADEPVPLLQMALTLNRYNNHTYFAAYPILLQKVLFKMLAPLAHLLGYSSELDYKKSVSEKRSFAVLQN